MDERFTYVTPDKTRVTVWAPPGVVPDAKLPFSIGKRKILAVRLDSRSLDCERVNGVTGECGSAECHRRELGKCQCGRHPAGTRIVPDES